MADPDAPQPRSKYDRARKSGPPTCGHIIIPMCGSPRGPYCASAVFFAFRLTICTRRFSAASWSAVSFSLPFRTHGHQILSVEAELLHQPAFDRLGAALRKPLVVACASLGVGMTSDHEPSPFEFRTGKGAPKGINGRHGLLAHLSRTEVEVGLQVDARLVGRGAAASWRSLADRERFVVRGRSRGPARRSRVWAD
jgi:hypothetical protein